MPRPAIPRRRTTERIQRGDPEARARLLEEVSRVLRSRGFVGTTMRQLADDLGMSAASFYYHFPNKEELLAQTLELELERLSRHLATVVHRDTPALGQLESLVRATLRFQVEWQALVQGPGHSIRSMTHLVDSIPPEHRGPVDRAQRRILDLVRSVLKRGVDSGEMDVPDLTVTAFALLSLGEHLVTWYRPGGRLGAEALIDMLTTLAMRMVDGANASRGGIRRSKSTAATHAPRRARR